MEHSTDIMWLLIITGVFNLVFHIVTGYTVRGTIESSFIEKRPGCRATNISLAQYTPCKLCTEGFAMDCSHANLTFVPSSFPSPSHKFKSPMCILDLRYNSIHTIQRNAFRNASSIRCLYLSHNLINVLEQDAFVGLESLIHLNVSHNELKWTDGNRTAIAERVFEPLKQLRLLNLKDNLIRSYRGLDAELQYLVSLEDLFIDGCAQCKFGRKIKRLHKLRKLSFSGKTARSCNMATLTNDTFEYFYETGLTHLYLSCCNITKIDTFAFRPFNKSLVELDMSYNEELTFTGMNDALNGLTHSGELTVLNVNRIHSQYERGTILEMKHVLNLHTLHNLTSLYMDLNKLEVFDVKVLYPYYLTTSLSKVSLAGNRLTWGKYMTSLGHVTGLKDLDISRQHSNFDPFDDGLFKDQPARVHTQPKCTCAEPNPKCNRIIIPRGLKQLKWRESFLHFEIPRTLVCNGEHLLKIDVSLNLITVLEGPVDGLSAVTHLDISYNLCGNISSDFFRGFTSLKHLNLSFNKLGKALASPHGRYAFKDVKSLEILDLSSNKITTLYRDVFVHLNNLKHLNLSSNDIDIWDIDLWNSNCLQTLDLSDNVFEYLPDNLERYLDVLTKQTCNNNTHITLVMAYNPVRCSCHTVPFLKWMVHTKVEVHFSKYDECHLQHGQRYKLAFGLPQLVKELELKCIDYGWLIAACTSVLVCIMTTTSTLLVYRKRWKLRHMYYSKRRRHGHKDYQRIFVYDAFVSYPKELAKLVKDQMVPALEDNRGLKLWVTDRNSHPGASIAENIVHALYNSRKSIHLLNKDYFRDKWCDYEINMANMEAIETKRRFVVIVDMGVDTKDVPLTAMRLLDSHEDLKYPTEGNEEEVCAFWTRLAEIVITE